METSELTAARQELQRQRAEARETFEQTARELAWLSILRAEFDGRRLKDCDANRGIIFGWLNPGEDYPTVKLLQEIFQQRPQEKQKLVWEPAPLTAEQTRQAEQTDREEFTKFCKAHRFNDGVAGLNLAQEVLGRGNVTEHGLANAVRTRRLRLAPASADELAEREAERIDQEQLRLRSASIPTLKQEVRDGYADRRAASAQAEADRVFAEKQKHDDMVGGFPPLPDTFKGRRLDKKFFTKMQCTREELKFLTQKYGSANIEARIRGIR